MNSDSVSQKTCNLNPGDGQAVLAREVRELSRISGLRSSAHLAAEWLVVFALIYLGHRLWRPWLYLPLILVIASRQHALMILLHEGTHYRLYRKRKLNDWVSELLLAWPVLTTMRAYRANHFAHHRYLNTDRDPDWVRRNGDPDWIFPKTPREMLWLFAGDLTGRGAQSLVKMLRTVSSQDSAPPRTYQVSRYAFYGAVMIAAVRAGAVGSILLFWFVPLLTCLVFLFRIRSIAEHSGIDRKASPAGTRTTLAFRLERVVLAPKNVNYHLEHHLYPSVPFYRLPQLHALLMARPDFSGAHITRGYFNVLRECIVEAGADSARTEHPTLGNLALEHASGPD